MFIGHEKELAELHREFSNWNKKTAVLVYGKRRVGKSSLINEASKDFDGVVINHICVTSSFEGNLELISKSVSASLSLPRIRFNSLSDIIEYLGTIEKKFLFIIDEYPYLKQTKKAGAVDSLMQSVIDRLPSNVKLVLCGSYITIMKELLEEGNPLFGRFSLIQHIRDFDYYDAARFYPNLPAKEKIAFYAVFGGSPFVLNQIEPAASLRDNIISLLLPETGVVKVHIESIMLKEIQRSYDIRILESLGNGKKRYTEIRDWLGSTETGLLDKQLKVLLDMETIQKSCPINRKSDKKKQFYEIVDNLMRFYFSFLFGNTGSLMRLGPEQFCKSNIDEKINQFISRRFEELTLQYFHRLAIKGDLPDLEDFGSYWYDDPVQKKNGEFNCVIKRTGNQYDFYECKYYDRPMSQKECLYEEKQLSSIPDIKVSRIGFICTGGFDLADSNNYILIDGNMLYE